MRDLAQHEYDALVSFFPQRRQPRVLPIHAGQETQRRGLRGPVPSCCAGASSGEKTRAAHQRAAVRWAGYTARSRVPPMPRGNAMNLIPWPYRWLAVAALAVALIGFGWIRSYGPRAGAVGRRRPAANPASRRHRERRAGHRQRSHRRYVDRVRISSREGRHRISLEGRLWRVQATMLLALSAMAVRLHGAAAAGGCPIPPGCWCGRRGHCALCRLPAVSARVCCPATRPATKTPSNWGRCKRQVRR